jgi:hypothetical protein
MLDERSITIVDSGAHELVELYAELRSRHHGVGVRAKVRSRMQRRIEITVLPHTIVITVLHGWEETNARELPQSDACRSVVVTGFWYGRHEVSLIGSRP